MTDRNHLSTLGLCALTAILFAVLAGPGLAAEDNNTTGGPTNETAPTERGAVGVEGAPDVVLVLAGLLIGGGGVYGVLRWRLGPAYRLVVDVAAATADKRVTREEAKRLALDVVDALYGEEDEKPDAGRPGGPSP